MSSSCQQIHNKLQSLRVRGQELTREKEASLRSGKFETLKQVMQAFDTEYEAIVQEYKDRASTAIAVFLKKRKNQDETVTWEMKDDLSFHLIGNVDFSNTIDLSDFPKIISVISKDFAASSTLLIKF